MTGTSRVAFFAKQILGIQAMGTNLMEALTDQNESVIGAVIGECVLDPDDTGGLGISASVDGLNDRRLTVNGSRDLLTDSGRLMTVGDLVPAVSSNGFVIQDPLWFSDVPFENANATTYGVYAGRTTIPTDVGVSSVGSRGYSLESRVVGFSVNPDSVDIATVPGKIVLKLDAGLTSLGMQHWLTSHTDDTDWSYRCVIWLDDSVAGVSVSSDDPTVAIAYGYLVKDPTTGAWMVDITAVGDGKLGQFIVSTDTTHYKVALLGPIVTTDDLSGSPDWTLIGAVTSGASESIDLSNQNVVKPYSQFIDNTDEFDSILIDGWTSIPGVLIQNSDELHYGAGSAFAGGQIISANAGFVTALADTLMWSYYDSSSGEWGITDDFDVAIADGRIPAHMAYASGGVLTSASIFQVGRSVAHFNETVCMTVSAEQSHGAAFRTLEGALGALVSMQQNSVIPAKAAEIRIVGDIQVNESMTSTLLSLTIGLRVVGSTVRNRSGSTTVAQSGSRIIWNFDGPLFDLSGTDGINGWSFENLVFKYEGIGTSDNASIIVSTGAPVSGLTFKNCVVDGSPAMSSETGAGLGKLSHVLFTDTVLMGAGASVDNLCIDGCTLATVGSTVLMLSSFGAGATQPLDGLTLIDNDILGPSLAPIGSYGGGIITFGNPGNAWTVRRNRAIGLNGPVVMCDSGLTNSDISDNSELSVSGDLEVIKLLNSESENVRINGNTIFRSNGTIAGYLIYIVAKNMTSKTDLCGIFIRDNTIYDTLALSSTAIYLEGNSSTGLTFVASGNMMKSVGVGIDARYAYMSRIKDNTMVVSSKGVFMTDVLRAGNFVSGNSINMNGDNAVGLDLSAAKYPVIIDHNHISTENDNCFGLVENDALNLMSQGSNLISSNVFNIRGANGTSIVQAGYYSLVSANLVMTGDLRIHNDSIDSLFVGNLLRNAMFYSDGSAIGSMLVGNRCGDGDGFTSGIGTFNWSGSVAVMVGNYFPGPDYNFSSANFYVMSGNRLSDITFSGFSPSVVASNYIVSWDDTAGGDKVFACNFVYGVNGATLTSMGVHDGAIVGNYFAGPLELEAGSSELAIVGNMIDDPIGITDNGASNLVISNVIGT